MKNRITELLKRYFLWAAAYRGGPFAAGAWIMIPLIVITGFGAIAVYLAGPGLREFFVRWPNLGSDCMVASIAAGGALGTLNSLVARFFVNHRNESGLYFRVKDGKVEAANPQWGKDGFWVWLPPTDREHEVRFSRGNVPAWSDSIVLKVFFRGAFDPNEVYEKIAAELGFRNFDDWLCSRFTAAMGGYAGLKVREALGQLRDRTRAEVEGLLRGIDFPRPMDNIDYIEAHIDMAAVVRFR